MATTVTVLAANCGPAKQWVTCSNGRRTDSRRRQKRRLRLCTRAFRPCTDPEDKVSLSTVRVTTAVPCTSTRSGLSTRHLRQVVRQEVDLALVRQPAATFPVKVHIRLPRVHTRVQVQGRRLRAEDRSDTNSTSNSSSSNSNIRPQQPSTWDIRALVCPTNLPSRFQFRLQQVPHLLQVYLQGIRSNIQPFLISRVTWKVSRVCRRTAACRTCLRQVRTVLTTVLRTHHRRRSCQHFLLAGQLRLRRLGLPCHLRLRLRTE